VWQLTRPGKSSASGKCSECTPPGAGTRACGPTAALLRFRKAGKVPLHEHPGYEHIIVLAGSQRDQNSAAAAGTLIVNPPGTSHSVVGEAGCIVLAIYGAPVQFLPDRRDDQR